MNQLQLSFLVIFYEKSISALLEKPRDWILKFVRAAAKELGLAIRFILSLSCNLNIGTGEAAFEPVGLIEENKSEYQCGNDYAGDHLCED